MARFFVQLARRAIARRFVWFERSARELPALVVAVED